MAILRNTDQDADPAVLVSDLSLSYPAHGGAREFQAVEGVSFSLSRGGVLAVLGESGSGKSTLTRYLAARATDPAQKADHIKSVGGVASTLGVSLQKLSSRQQRKLTAFIGYLEQDAGATLPPDLNVGDIIFQPIEERIKRFNRSELGEQVAEMFDILGLPLNFLQKYPYELSKGQRQRVAVIRSLIQDPTIYIADEPTLGVDANNRPRIIELIQWYRKRTGATMLLISHDIGMLEALVQDILVLQQGSTVGYGDINEIFRRADHGYVQQLAEALRATAYDELATE